jgi:5-methylcytosine-specific restriction endonuclease McrBC regulatory subunit McrC
LGRDPLWDLLLAFVFRRRFMEAISVGMFREYHTFYHNDARIRGRIDLNEHLRRNIPFRGTVAYTTHEITFDNPTNHLIRHALEKVRRKWPGCLMGNHRLTEAEHQLELGTPTWQKGGVLACIRRKENRGPVKHPYFGPRYEQLRQVSLAILRDEGASLYQPQQQAEGVIFDGSWLWEEYLWTLLKQVGFSHTENKKKAGEWETRPGVRFYPDFFHLGKRAVLDAKYKGQGVDQEDAKQVFAYMFLADALHGGLIKPDGEQEGIQPELKKITRQRVDSEQTSWHNLVLSPPVTTSATAAKDFMAEMHRKEEELMDHIRSLVP